MTRRRRGGDRLEVRPLGLKPVSPARTNLIARLFRFLSEGPPAEFSHMGGMIGSRNLTRMAGPSRGANGQKPSGHEVEKILPKVVSHVTFSAPKTIAPDRRYRSPPTVTATLQGSPSLEPPSRYFWTSRRHLQTPECLQETAIPHPPPTGWVLRLRCQPALSADNVHRAIHALMETSEQPWMHLRERKCGEEGGNPAARYPYE